MQTKYRFRNLYGEASRDKVENVRPSKVTSESWMARGNSTSFAFCWDTTGGGALAVLPNSTVGKLPANFPMIRGHQGAIVDFDFSPFADNIIATASDDLTAKVWSLPTHNEFKTDLIDASVVLSGHGKKVTLLAWNPTSENVIATTSMDKTVRVWDITNPSNSIVLPEAHEVLLSLEWNFNGSLLGGTTKDRKLRLIDPRARSTISETNTHEGSKGQKFTWLGETGLVVTSGFSSNQERQYSLWDLKNLSQPLNTKNIDNASGVLYPFFDADLGILYLAGKGDGNIRSFEFSDGDLHYNSAPDYRSTVASRAYGFYPKRAVNVMKHEVARVIKVSEKEIEFVSFIAPRRAPEFQEDLFPDCISEVPAQTAEDWFNGNTVAPNRRSMRPDANVQSFTRSQVLTTSLNANDAKIKALEEQVASLQAELSNRNNTIAEIQAVVARLTEQNELLKQTVANFENAQQKSHEQQSHEQQ